MLPEVCRRHHLPTPSSIGERRSVFGGPGDAHPNFMEDDEAACRLARRAIERALSEHHDGPTAGARPRAHRKPTATTNSKPPLPEVGTLLIDGGRMDVTKKSGIVAAHLELGVVTAVEEREITIQVRRSMLQSHASAPCSRSARHALST